MIVVGLLRGGLAVAVEVAKALRAPVYGLVCRKISPPGNPEYAIGALCEDVLYAEAGVPQAAIEQAEAEVANYHKNLPVLSAPPVKNKTVIIVDDGLATGRTAFAAAKLARQKGAKTVIISAPVASLEAAAEAREIADRTEFIDTPAEFWAVGQFYEQFNQVDFNEVKQILKQNHYQPAGPDRA